MSKELLLNFLSTQGYKKNSPDVNNPINVIPSGDITMKDVEFPVHGIDDLGNEQIMMPETDYTFPGDYVVETPIKQEGGSVKSRKGVRNNPDGSHSTHLMRREYIPEKGWVAFPSLFQNEDSTWVDMSSDLNEDWDPIYKEAVKRGEVYEFGENEQKAIDFADKGSWKNKPITNKELGIEKQFKPGGSVHKTATAVYNIKKFIK